MKLRVMLTVLVMVLLATACGSKSVSSLEVGDCFDDEASQTLGEVAEVSTVPIVDCGEPHDNEIFAIYDEVGSGPYPGIDALLERARTGCIERFDAFVGISYFDSELEVFSITPSEDGWDDGDREVICSLYEISLAKMTGTQRGVAR